MAVPKKKTSVSRKGLRRAGQHHKLYGKTTMSCPNCGDTVLPLHVCPACGTYKGATKTYLWGENITSLFILQVVFETFDIFIMRGNNSSHQGATIKKDDRT